MRLSDWAAQKATKTVHKTVLRGGGGWGVSTLKLGGGGGGGVYIKLVGGGGGGGVVCQH